MRTSCGSPFLGMRTRCSVSTARVLLVSTALTFCCGQSESKRNRSAGVSLVWLAVRWGLTGEEQAQAFAEVGHDAVGLRFGNPQVVQSETVDQRGN